MGKPAEAVVSQYFHSSGFVPGLTASGSPVAGGRLAVSTVTLVGYGSIVGGTGAQAQILVNGKPVSGLLEFKPAVDPAGY
jgi:hypothetical protein